MTLERTLPVLEAAHIRPYRQNGPHDISTGLCLRSDLHRLLDKGYLTIDPDDRSRHQPIRRRCHRGSIYCSTPSTFSGKRSLLHDCSRAPSWPRWTASGVLSPMAKPRGSWLLQEKTLRQEVGTPRVTPNRASRSPFAARLGLAKLLFPAQRQEDGL